MAEGNLGTVSFGIEAYTKEMDKAVSKIRAFGKVVTDAAAKQVKGHEKVVKALTAQEVAMRKAKAATDTLGQSVMRSKLAEEEQGKILQKVTQDLNAYVNVMGKVKTSEHDATIATTKFNEALGQSKAKFNDMKKAASATGLTDVMRNMESAAVLAIGPLSGLGARIRSLGSIASRVKLSIAALIGVAVATGVAFWKMSAAALNASKVFEASMARFKAATGSAQLARAEMNFIIETSLELGLRIEDTAKAYSRLTAASKGTSLAGLKTRKVFLSIATAAAALRLNQGEVEGAFRAIEQMMSKGTVQAEELRGQLGERLPGAFRLAAEAMEMTTQELGKALKAGEVTAEMFLPRLADAIMKSLGADAQNNVNSFTGSMNNLANRALLFAKEWDRVTNTSGIFIAAIHAADAALGLLTKSLEFIIKSIGALTAAMTVLYWKQIGAAVMWVAAAIRTAAVATWAWTAALLANPLGAVASLATKLVTALVAVGAAIAAWVGLDMVMEDFTEELDAAAEKAQKAQDELQKLTEIADEAKSVSKLTDDINELAYSLDSIKHATDLGKNAKEIELFYRALQHQEELEGLPLKALETKAKRLAEILGREVEPTVEGVASAMFRLTETERIWIEGMENGVQQLEVLKDAQLEASKAREKLRISSTGTNEDVRYFEQVTSKVLDYEAAMKLTNQGTQEQADAVRAYREALAAAFFRLEMVTEQEKERDAAAKASTKSVDILAKAELKLADMRARLAAAEKGEEALRYYDKVTKAVNSYRDAIAKAKMSDEERANALAAFERVMADLLIAETAITDERKRQAQATKELNAAEAEHLRAVERAIKAMQKADDKLEIMRERLRALKGGPDSFEVFNEVTSKVMAFEDSLERANVPLAEMQERVREFRELLLEEREFKQFAKLADDMANAIGNSLEGLLTGSKSLKDTFKDLAAELWTMILRVLFLDPLVKSLSSSMANFMSGSMGGGTGSFFDSLFDIGVGMFGGGGIGGTVTAGTTGMVTSNLGVFPPMAKGGTALGNKDYLVGDEGPEILRMGPRSGRILNNAESDRELRQGGSGGDTYYNVVNLPEAYSRKPARQLGSEIHRRQKAFAARNS